MRAAITLLLLVSVLGFGVSAWFGLHPAPPRAAATEIDPFAHVLVAANDIRAGALLASGDLKAREIRKNAVPPGAISDTPEHRAALFGAMIRHPVPADAPILEGEALRPGEHGFLAAVLGGGMQAATVAVDAVSGSAGLIWPGDHVNLVLTQTLDDPKLPAGRRVAAETVLSDVRVIAIDQQLMEGATGAKTQQAQAGTVTLEVTPRQNEKVSVAAHLGKLSLAVLSARGGAPVPAGAMAADSITWARDVSPALADAAPPPSSPPPPLRIFRGASDAQEY
ncbi:MAG: Flp pilus assembly protein CpaB [Gluconacetobacter diazotrophicus]|nr:Flp pilus assembly protein CpaB [Gluconacetobacter diazotrophicus]